MSWRLIIAILLLAAGASAWGGLRLGDWLIIHSPSQVQQTPEPTNPQGDTPVLGANGQPFVASAPQPLPNGRLGVPSQPPPVDWQLQTTPLLSENRPIALATTTISMDEAIALAAQGQMGDNGLQGIANIDTLLNQQTVQPIDVPPPPSASGPANTPTQENWQAAFQSELKSCETLGFFSRPSCAWAARNKYCEPNQAWGKAPDCPIKR